jgi:DNA-binding NarL/FixJ family response regulator
MISVIIADGHSLFRQAVRSALETEDGLSVVAEAADGIEAVAQTEQHKPDVVLIDADLPNSTGVHTTRLIHARSPASKVLVLSNHPDPTALFDAMQAGASGFMTKAAPLRELIRSTRAMLQGETIVPPSMLGHLLSELVETRSEQNNVMRRLARLTRREREVLALLVEGGDNDVVANRLVISPETARTHIQNILGKLDVHSRLEALSLVLRNNIAPDMILN